MKHADDCHNSVPDPFDTDAWKDGVRLHKCTCGLTALREKAALADDLYRIWRGHEHACRSTMYLEHWMGRYEAIK